MNREVRVIMSMRVIDSERPCWVMFDAVESNRVAVLVEGYSANDIMEPTYMGGENKIDKIGRDVYCGGLGDSKATNKPLGSLM